jgi:hypothetical protein
MVLDPTDAQKLGVGDVLDLGVTIARGLIELVADQSGCCACN